MKNTKLYTAVSCFIAMLACTVAFAQNPGSNINQNINLNEPEGDLINVGGSLIRTTDSFVNQVNPDDLEVITVVERDKSCNPPLTAWDESCRIFGAVGSGLGTYIGCCEDCATKPHLPGCSGIITPPPPPSQLFCASPLVECPSGCCKPCNPLAYALSGTSGNANVMYETCGDCGTQEYTCKSRFSTSGSGSSAVLTISGYWQKVGDCKLL